MDWQEVGKNLALILGGAAAAIPAIRRFWPEPLRPSLPADLLQSVLDTLRATRAELEEVGEASREAANAVNFLRDGAMESQVSLGAQLGALRDLISRLEGLERRWAREAKRLEREP